MSVGTTWSLAITAFVSATLIAGGAARGDVSGVFSAPDDDKKAAVLIKQRRSGLTASDIVLLARREKSSAIVGLGLGIYLESNPKLDATEAAAAVFACAKRKDMFGITVTIAALSPHVEGVVDALMSQKKPGGADARRVAASILAMYARASTIGSVQYATKKRDDQGLLGAPADPKKKNKKNRPGKGRGRQARLTKIKPDVLAGYAKDLLTDRTAEVLEPALLAAAYLKIKPVAEQVKALEQHRAIEVQAARLLYMAQIGQPLPADLIARIFASRQRPLMVFTKLNPYLSNYQVTASPLCYACEAIGGAGGTEHLPQLHKALTDRDLRVQIEAARAIGRIADPSSVAPLLAAMNKCDWPVLVDILWALGGIASTDSIEPLIARLEKETGRFRLDVIHALSSIACEQHGQTAGQWRTWWSQAKEQFKPDPKKTVAFRKAVRVQDVDLKPLAFFYSVPLFSDRLVFVLDTSASMRGAKILSLKENLTQTLQSLKPPVRFNVVDFGGHVQVMKPNSLIPAARGGTTGAIQLVAYMKLTLGTRTYDGMEAGTWLPGMDTLVYLSDGAPVASKINSWGRIVHAVALLNRYRPVAFYTVEFHAGGANAASMAELAARFWGLSGAPQQ